MVKEITTKTSRNWIDNGILFSENVGGNFIDLEEAKTISKVFKELAPDPLPLIVELGAPKGQSKEARDFFSSDPNHVETYTAVALLVSSPISKILANFYLGLNKPPKPTKLFTSRESAISWCEQYK